MGTYPLRPARADDAERVALLHADSWRRHYRGAYADSFIDGDVEADRLGVWAGRLAAPGRGATLPAEDDKGLAGFIHVVFDDDPRWGSLIDNLHVRAGRHRDRVDRRVEPTTGHAHVLQIWSLVSRHQRLEPISVASEPVGSPPRAVDR
ncbi:MAG TPA: hypothetical protein VGD29_34190 [Actinoplanes sp.]